MVKDNPCTLTSDDNKQILNIFHQNVQGLTVVKTLMLEELFKNEFNTIDVICVTEHWKKSDEITFVNIPNYKLVACYCRTQKERGGSCIYVKTELEVKTNEKFKNLNTEKHFESCIIEIELYSVVIICIYRTPDSDITLFVDKVDMLVNYFQTKRKHVVIIGDINIDFLKPQVIDSKVHIMLQTHNLEAAVKEPTRITGNSQSAIDQILLNKNAFHCHTRVFSSGFSDHLAQTFTLSKVTSDTSKTKKVKDKQFQHKRVFNQVNTAHFLWLLNRESWADVYQSKTVDEAWDTFLTAVKHYFEIAFPKKWYRLLKSSSKTWVTEGIKISSNKLRLLNKIRSHGNTTTKFLNYYRKYQNTYKKVIMAAKKLSNERIIKQSVNKNKTMWTLVKRELNNEISHKNITLSYDGETVDDPNRVANIFNEYFVGIASTYSNDRNKNNWTNVKNNTCEHTMFLSPTTTSEVEKIIQKMKEKRSAGIDEIPQNIVKKCHKELGEPLCFLINLSFSQGIFPNALKLAKVIPIHKKGNKTCPENYRPISLITTFAKILEIAMKNRLTTFLQKYNLISEEQHGFCRGKSTDTAIFNYLDYIHNLVDRNEKCIGLFLDLTKAFDLVPHKELLNKLNNYGIRGTSNTWFKSYLENREQIVQIDNINRCNNTRTQHVSGRKRITCGVPQGSVLGPVLFQIYINDLPTFLSSAKCTLFADDTSVAITGKTHETLHENIKSTITELTQWFNYNKFKVNIEKTTAINFRSVRNYSSTDPPIIIGNKAINYNSSVKFLGICINEHLKWDEHIQNITNKLCKTYFAIKVIKQKINASTAKILYYSSFESLLRFGIIFWGQSKVSKQVFILQKKTLRLLAGARPREACRKIFKQLSLLPLPCLYIYELLTFVKRNSYQFIQHTDVHAHNTRNKTNLVVPTHNKTMIEKGPRYLGILLYNKLPNSVKFEKCLESFKNKVKDYLLQHCFYSVEEFLNL